MRSVKQIKNIKGKIILLRVDFNVPIKNGKVEDDFRIQKALPTIQFLQKKKAKIVLITHLGQAGETLSGVAESLGKFIEVKFVKDIYGAEAKQAVSDMKEGEVVLLENLRTDTGEKECNKVFAMNLARMADVYVNEAFPVDHREDASIVLLPKLLPSYAGLQLSEEIKNLSRAFEKAKHPFLFILGGAKFSTKMPLIQKYLKLADHVFVGGALANDFLKAKGFEVGKSLVDNASCDIANVLKSKKLVLPVDAAVESKGRLISKKISDVEKDESILDIGNETVENLAQLIKKAKFILWNGPLGKYEAGGGESTKKILKLVAESRAETIIGGGDTVSLITEMKMEKSFSFVSTGGGATLDFLANGTLPGIKALK